MMETDAQRRYKKKSLIKYKKKYGIARKKLLDDSMSQLNMSLDLQSKVSSLSNENYKLKVELAAKRVLAKLLATGLKSYQCKVFIAGTEQHSEQCEDYTLFCTMDDNLNIKFIDFISFR